MNSAELQALAKEREARRGVPTDSPAGAIGTPMPVPRAWAQRTTPAAPSNARSLVAAHRSIKLARSFGLACVALGLLLLIMGAGRTAVGVFVLGGIGMARAGAGLLHGALPSMLHESNRPPTAEEIALSSSVGLFSLDGLKNVGESLGAEYALALDSLAWCCSYGKKNCLTDQMYAGELSLGKICALVWGKLREGVIRC